MYLQECTYRELKKNDPELREFAKSVRSPLRHLSFREAFRGQIQDACILRYEEELCPNVTIHSIDCNHIFPREFILMPISTEPMSPTSGLGSPKPQKVNILLFIAFVIVLLTSVSIVSEDVAPPPLCGFVPTCNYFFNFLGMAMEKEIATGEYSITMVAENEQHFIKIEDESIYYRGIRFLGVALVRVLPPQDLFLPAINFNVQGANIGVLCLRCALDAMQKKAYKRCQHKEKARSFTSTYSTIDIIYGARLGYKFHFFEIAMFQKSEKLLQKFTLSLLFEKFLVCDYPEQCGASHKEKQQYLDTINNDLKFKEHLGKTLTVEIVHPNSRMKKLRKSILNCFLGYFNLNLDERTETLFLNSYRELARQINAGHVSNVVSFGDVVEVTKARRKCDTPSGQLKTNVMVS